MLDSIAILLPASHIIYFRFIRPIDGFVFDFDDTTWKANVAACTDPNLEAVENTDVGDAFNSLYFASVDLSDVNSSSTPMAVLVEAWRDEATDVLEPVTASFWVVSGKIELNTAAVDAIKAKTDNLPVDPASDTLVTSEASSITALINTLNNLDKATVKEILFTDITTELPKQAPPANAPIQVQLRYLYQYFCFLREQTTSFISMYDSAGNVVIAKAPISEAAGIAAKSKFVSG